MELGELVFTLNVKTAALMQGVEASIGAMNRLVNTEDKAGASANVLEGRLALLSRQYRMQSSSVENATRAWEQAVAAHGQGSNAANKAESALMKELAALQRLAERMNAANMSAKDLAAAQETRKVEYDGLHALVLRGCIDRADKIARRVFARRHGVGQEQL